MPTGAGVGLERTYGVEQGTRSRSDTAVASPMGYRLAKTPLVRV